MSNASAYTTQLQAGLGMIHETLDLLRLWQPGDSAARLAEKAVAAGTFSRATARRARNIVAEMFAPRFLSDAGRSACSLKQLLESGANVEDLKQLFFLYAETLKQSGKALRSINAAPRSHYRISAARRGHQQVAVGL